MQQWQAAVAARQVSTLAGNDEPTPSAKKITLWPVNPPPLARQVSMLVVTATQEELLMPGPWEARGHPPCTNRPAAYTPPGCTEALPAPQDSTRFMGLSQDLSQDLSQGAAYMHGACQGTSLHSGW